MDRHAHITLYLDGNVPGISEQKINYTELKEVLDAFEVFARRCYARARTQDDTTDFITPDSTVDVIFDGPVKGSLGIPCFLTPAQGQSPSLLQELDIQELGRIFERRLTQNTADTGKLKKAIQKKNLNASFTLANGTSTTSRITIDTTVKEPALPLSGVIHGTISALYFNTPAFDVTPDGDRQRAVRVHCSEAQRDALRQDFVSDVSVVYRSAEDKKVLLRITPKKAFSTRTMKESSDEAKNRWLEALRILGSS